MNQKDAYKLYEKIVEHAIASNGRITLALKDNYRQSGNVKNINISFSEDGSSINGIISFFEKPKFIEFDFAEIADVYS
jgi:hypothetical protein